MQLLGVNFQILRNEPVHQEDPKRVHHPVPDRVSEELLCRQTDEKHRDRDCKQNNRKMGDKKDSPEQYPGPTEVILLRSSGYDPV